MNTNRGSDEYQNRTGHATFDRVTVGVPRSRAAAYSRERKNRLGTYRDSQGPP
jgi:hypothetical protein